MERPEEKLLACFGMKLVKQLDFYRPMGLLDQELDQQQQIHEVAHFQVASPERRLMVNFGLGEDSVGSRTILTPEVQVQEEIRAFLLTLCWFEVLGIKSRCFGFRFRGEWHSVTLLKNNHKCHDALGWLLAKGLLDHNCRPTCLINLGQEWNESY